MSGGRTVQRPYNRETMHSALNLGCLSWHPLSQLLGGAAVSSQQSLLFTATRWSCSQPPANTISWGLTAAPPSSWDKGCPDKHHIGNVYECIVS